MIHHVRHRDGVLSSPRADDGAASPWTGDQHTFERVEPATDTAQHDHGIDSPA